MLPAFDWPLIVERQRREIEFLEILADNVVGDVGGPAIGGIAVNGTPWREAFGRLNELVGDPV